MVGLFVWHAHTIWDQSQELEDYERLVAKQKKIQDSINGEDTKVVSAQTILQIKVDQLNRELTDERLKNHTICSHTDTLRGLLHKASLPPSNLSR